MPSNDTNRARMEQAIATAHRAVWRAAEAAEEMGSEGDHEDLVAIMRELTRLQVESLKGRSRRSKQIAGQLDLLHSG
jgi:hypothetical protein